MIVCGWCESATEPGRCSYCGRDPALPWVQRAMKPPDAKHPDGRPKLDPSQIKPRMRLALKELGASATNAQLAEYLDVADSTVRRWRKMSGL